MKKGLIFLKRYGIVTGSLLVAFLCHMLLLPGLFSSCKVYKSKPYVEDLTLAVYSEKALKHVDRPREKPKPSEVVKLKTLAIVPVQPAAKPQERPRLPENHDLKPTYLETFAPVYPETARRNAQEGLVSLLVSVDENGVPTSIQVKQSSGYPLLDTSAVNAVKKWKFKPAFNGAYPVDSQVEIPIRFKLSEAR